MHILLWEKRNQGPPVSAFDRDAGPASFYTLFCRLCFLSSGRQLAEWETSTISAEETYQFVFYLVEDLSENQSEGREQ